MAQLEVLPRDTRIPELLVFEPEQVEIALGWEIPLSSLSHLCNYLGCRLSSWKFGSTRGTANPANSTGNRADKAMKKAPIFLAPSPWESALLQLEIPCGSRRLPEIGIIRAENPDLTESRARGRSWRLGGAGGVTRTTLGMGRNGVTITIPIIPA